MPDDGHPWTIPASTSRSATTASAWGSTGFSYVEGATLQEAAERLVEQLRGFARAFRGGIGAFSSEVALDPALLDFVWQLGETAAGGGDIRERL